MRFVFLALLVAGCAYGSVAPDVANEVEIETGKVYLPVLDAGYQDASQDALLCEDSIVIAHCLTNMATKCIEYRSDHETECLSTGMVSGYFPGPCATDERSSLTRSSGGCMDACGIITWSYRLGGYPPNDASREGVKATCEGRGLTYVSAD